MLSQIASHVNIPNIIFVMLVTGVMGWAGHNLMQTVDQTTKTATAIELMRQELTYKVMTLQEQVTSLRERLQQVYTVSDSSKDFALRDTQIGHVKEQLNGINQRLFNVETVIMRMTRQQEQRDKSSHDDSPGQ